MSLRAFHILFIACSGVLCLWMTGWAVLQHRSGVAGARLWAAFSIAALAGLCVYLVRFVRTRRRHA